MISTCGQSPASAASAAAAITRPNLHLVDLRVEEREPHAAGAQHRVRLLEVADDLGRLARVGQPVVGGGLEPAHLGLEVLQRKELVQRRVEQPDRHRQPAHLVQDRGEVGALELAELIERTWNSSPRVLELRRRRPVLGRRPHLGPPPARRGDEHPPDQLAPVLAEEHVLGPAEADPLGAERPGLRRVLGGVGVGPHPEAAEVVRPARGPRRSPRRSRARSAARRRRSPCHVEPSIAIVSPAASSASPIRTTPASASTLTAEAPVTQGRPMPRATSAACEALPPWAVRIPRAAWNPAMSSASVNGRTRITSSPSAARRTASGGAEHDRPPGGARATPRPRSSAPRTRRRDRRPGAGAPRAPRRRSSSAPRSRVRSPSATASTANRTAAWAGRLAVRV